MQTFTVEIDGLPLVLLRDTDGAFFIPGHMRGVGSALKPANEPICMARKPLDGTLGNNLLKHGTGAINVDGCRIAAAPGDKGEWPITARADVRNSMEGGPMAAVLADQSKGRWPANIILDGSDEVMGAFPETTTGICPRDASGTNTIYGSFAERTSGARAANGGDAGSAARFFYQVNQDELPSFEEVVVSWTSGNGPHRAVLQVDTGRSPPRVIVASPSTDDSGWNTFLFGNGPTALCQPSTTFIIGMATKSITGSKTLSWLASSIISVNTGAAKSATENGGSPAANADRGTPYLTIISGSTVSLPGVGPAPSRTQFTISASAVRRERKRLWYSSKADGSDRLGSSHPTVKPVDLMQYLVRLVTPKGGIVLDPFAGTGTTGEAAIREGCRAVLIEREPEYLADIERRCNLILAGPDTRLHATIKANGKVEDHPGPLFGETCPL